MAKDKGTEGHPLGGRTSDRIRDGKIQAQTTGPRPEADDRPSTAAIRSAEGHGLGRGATSDRSGAGT